MKIHTEMMTILAAASFVCIGAFAEQPSKTAEAAKPKSCCMPDFLKDDNAKEAQQTGVPAENKPAMKGCCKDGMKGGCAKDGMKGGCAKDGMKGGCAKDGKDGMKGGCAKDGKEGSKGCCCKNGMKGCCKDGTKVDEQQNKADAEAKPDEK